MRGELHLRVGEGGLHVRQVEESVVEVVLAHLVRVRFRGRVRVRVGVRVGVRVRVGVGVEVGVRVRVSVRVRVRVRWSGSRPSAVGAPQAAGSASSSRCTTPTGAPCLHARCSGNRPSASAISEAAEGWAASRACTTAAEASHLHA